MTRSRIVRHLRIAVSVVFGILCLLMIALWVRSYWYGNLLEWRTTPRLLQLHSKYGRIEFQLSAPPLGHRYTPTFRDPPFRLHKFDIVGEELLPFVPDISALGFVLYRGNHYCVVCVPYWLVCLTCAFFTAAPWLPWRRGFSLRELLLATTLVAAVLGLVAAIK